MWGAPRHSLRLVRTSTARLRLGERGSAAYRAFVRGASDRRLELTIGSHGGLRMLMAQVAARVPGFAVKFAGELQCDLRRSDGSFSTWTIDTRSGRAVARAGPAERPALTARLSVADFVRMTAGELDPGNALLDGRLDLSGDFSVVTRLGARFGFPLG